jgi:hypothetical protein
MSRFAKIVEDPDYEEWSDEFEHIEVPQEIVDNMSETDEFSPYNS